MCQPSPCGYNAHCRVRNDFAVCECFTDQIGNPYTGCRPECVSNSECSKDRSCIRNKCIDSCPGVCGIQAGCSVINHTPVCTCPIGMTGDPLKQCSIDRGMIFK